MIKKNLIVSLILIQASLNAQNNFNKNPEDKNIAISLGQVIILIKPIACTVKLRE